MAKKATGKSAKKAAERAAEDASASGLIDARIEELDDWRGKTLARVRQLIRQADRGIVEDVKWRKPSNPGGVPVWSHDGIVCTGETYKDKVKLTFAKGASLEDPSGLFNASLTAGTRRAIDLREGDRVNAAAFKALVREAVGVNREDAAERGAAKKTTKKKGKAGANPRLLSGGNPQIAKGDGEGPVRAYIEAMPGWKRGVGERLDEIVEGAAPRVRRAVRWNSPFYGVEGKGWFLSFHCFAKYVKVTFLNGASLRPPPPVESKHAQVRYLHIHEGEEIDEAQLARWVKQASKIDGDTLF